MIRSEPMARANSNEKRAGALISVPYYEIQREVAPERWCTVADSYVAEAIVRQFVAVKVSAPKINFRLVESKVVSL